MEVCRSSLKLPLRENNMKKHFQITILAILFFIVNPLALLNEINHTNQINHISSAFAQETKKQVEPGPIQIHESYVIGQGDMLEVFVWRNEQLSRQVTVRPDGKISLPLIQDLQAEGLTVLQLTDQITRRLKQYVQNPTVTVIISEIGSYKISVLGKVAAPGVYSINTRTTLLEAISLAGGFTEWANKRKITVIRNEGGRNKKIQINYNKIVSGKDPSQNITLQRGDTIVVP
jgi:polysaccharide export outer membrane protein